MVLLYSEMISLGTPAPDFSLPGVDGKKWSLSDFNKSKLLVIMFICNHCPYVKAVQQRLVQLQSEYDVEEVQMVGISSNDVKTYPEDSFEMMKKVADEQGYNFPYLYDETQEVAKAYSAVCTPDIFVFEKERKLVYRGRLDDNWKEPENVSSRDLKKALDHLLDDEKIPFEQISSMGCSIKWKN